MLSIVCCLLAYVVGIAYVRLQNGSDSPLERNNAVTQPLLPNLEQLLEMELAINTIANYRPLLLVSVVFFIAAISKATRPLFTSYIQRRYGVSPTKVSSSIDSRLLRKYKAYFRRLNSSGSCEPPCRQSYLHLSYRWWCSFTRKQHILQPGSLLQPQESAFV